MNSDTGIIATTDLIGRLKAAVEDLSEREKATAREFRSRSFSANRAYEEGSEKVEKTLAAQIAQTEERFQEARRRATELHAERKARIERAYRTSRQFQRQRAENIKGSQLGSVQVGTYRAEQARDEGMAAADAVFGEVAGTLEEARAQFDQLRARAARDFRGYWKFLRLLPKKDFAGEGADGSSAASPEEAAESLPALLERAGDRLAQFESLLLPRLFRWIPLPAAVVLVTAIAWVAYAADAFGSPEASLWGSVAGGGLVILALAILHRMGAAAGRESAEATAAALREAAGKWTTAWSGAEARRAAEHGRLAAEHEETIAKLQEKWNRAQQDEAVHHQSGVDKVEIQIGRVRAKNDHLMNARLERFETEYPEAVEALETAAEEKIRALKEILDKELAAAESARRAAMEEIASDWEAEAAPLHRSLAEHARAARSQFPEWTKDYMEGWTPPADFIHAARFGEVHVDFAPAEPADDSALELPGPAEIKVPLALSIPTRGSLLIECADAGRDRAIGVLNSVILRLLATTPPGKLSFTLFDPVGLGESFAGLMHLADYEESLLNRRIWTQTSQMEQRLSDLNEHIEKVIQMYLRNEYETITDYNRQAGMIAEKYHFLVIADFPAGFSDAAAKRLMSIAASGARCGVFTLIHWDRRHPLPSDFVPEELRENSVCVRGQKGQFQLQNAPAENSDLVLDEPPPQAAALDFVHRLGSASRDSNRVEVPFEHVAPEPAERWTGDTTDELQIAIGRTGATKLQRLAIGKGTRQHALFAGKTGSGKSTLFHVIITNLALTCSPEQVEFYLIDFKKGVEFKCYADKKLPHARVVAIESDREFALSVLQRVDDELKRRGDIFRKLGVQDLAGYKRAGGTDPMPRSLLIIDEFQEYFVEDDRIAQGASVLLDRIVRQGRAFGIHVLLGSQTLGGAYTLARTTLGQMVIRVALQCNEADAYLIMDDSNPAPRLLSRPGEGIYNDAAGAVEGNSPFQVVWLSDAVRDAALEDVRDLARKSGKNYPAPIVFEGNAPADVRENPVLNELLNAESLAPTLSPRAWLGAPNSIKGPTEAAFHRQSGNHLLVIGQRDDAAIAILGVSMISLAVQHPADGARFIVLDGSLPESPERAFLESIAEAIPHDVRLLKPGDTADAMSAVAEEMKSRADHDSAAPGIFVIVNGLQKFKKLRSEDEFEFSLDDTATEASPASQFTDAITEGSPLGIHLLVTVDTLNNINRFMTRKALSEFEMRVLFQMSANDSASLIDSPKAGNLGLHRALFYNEQEGYLETFRPYGIPDAAWIRGAAESLARLTGSSSSVAAG